MATGLRFRPVLQLESDVKRKIKHCQTRFMHDTIVG